MSLVTIRCCVKKAGHIVEILSLHVLSPGSEIIESFEVCKNQTRPESPTVGTAPKHRCDKRQKIIINVNKRVNSEKDSKRL